jgi:prevent-host-death family protein
MKNISIADAKARLSELVERAESGDQICITRRGKPVAKLVSVDSAREPIDMARLRAVTADMPKQRQSAGPFVRKMRDEDRY